MKKFFLIFFVLFYNGLAIAQLSTARLPGQIIVWLHSGIRPDFLHERFSTTYGSGSDFPLFEAVAPDLNIWLIRIDQMKYNESQVLAAMRSFPEVKFAQFNHLVRDRKIPNDPHYFKQWYWNNSGADGGIVGADTKAELAWNISTGGTTSEGDTIVVAVIDSGIDLNHEDLKDNIWYNRQDPPGNNVDDDGNGYVDDYRGWNVQEKNDNTQSSLTNDHGVLVSGVIGAKGNNSKGITGVNWNVKIMTVRANSSSWLLDNTEVNVLAAYAYILKMRKLYNESGGLKGAFVVSTNASWGVDEAKPEDSPIWCNFYDTLGYYGILNCAATTNNYINVDIRGDLPTTCPSDYLIAVQASGNTDVNNSSGFGKMNIDLAAPGKGILSTGIGSAYKSATGTSFASPMVSGTVGLLYAAPGKLSVLSKNYPSAAAKIVRKSILDGVDHIVALNDQNATGGRLNIYQSINKLNQVALKCSPPVNVKMTSVADNSALLNFDVLSEIKRVNLYYKPDNTSIWVKKDNVKTNHELTDLQSCQQYDFQLEYYCGLDSVRSEIYRFKTQGCCEIPMLSLEKMTNNSITLKWDAVIGTQRYDIRRFSNGNWDTVATYAKTINFDKLNSCSVYEFQLRAVCDSAFAKNFPFSTSLVVKTTGCGACIDNMYCIPRGISSFEWINKVELNTLSNSTPGATNGYQEYPAVTTTLSRGQQYNLELFPGYVFNPTNVYFRAWIDYNQDGFFDEETEVVFDKKRTVIDTSATGKITVPWSAKTGLTRLRVGMRAILATDSITPFSACERGLAKSFFGEFEDYCVIVEPGFTPCPFLANPLFTTTAGTIQIRWDTLPGALGYEVYHKKANDADWNMNVVLKGSSTFAADECADYQVKFRTVCGSDLSDFSKIFTVKSHCTTATMLSDDSPVAVFFPNPFSDNIAVKCVSKNDCIFKFELLSPTGQTLSKSEERTLGAGEISFFWTPDQSIPSGVYYVRCTIGGRTTLNRIVKL